MRYPCLVVDHDDTVVDSTATVHYPCFVEYTGIYHPEVHYTLDEYIKDNFDPGIVALFRDIIGMSEEEMEREQRYWNDYVKRHVPIVAGLEVVEHQQLLPRKAAAAHDLLKRIGAGLSLVRGAFPAEHYVRLGQTVFAVVAQDVFRVRVRDDAQRAAGAGALYA
mgnify:CR=1 FL=1